VYHQAVGALSEVTTAENKGSALMAPTKAPTAGTIVLTTSSDLDEHRVPRLRQHGARGGGIELGIDGVPPPNAVRSGLALTSAARDCGCELGGRLGALTLIAAFVVHRRVSGGLVPHDVTSAAGMAGATIAGALSGKAIGILRARRRLARELRNVRALVDLHRTEA
jgi:hypothetical protein